VRGSDLKSKRSDINDYGIKGYFIGKPANLDNPNVHIQNWKNQKLQANGKKTYFDDIIKISKSKLSPQIYAKQADWKERSLSQLLNGHRQKDVFRKGKRETLNEELIRVAKNKQIPAPGAYNLPAEKIQNIPKQTREQCVMVDDSKWKAMQVPAAKYDIHKGVDLSRPTIFKLRMFPPPKKESEKPKKSKDPDMGSYDSLVSFKKT